MFSVVLCQGQRRLASATYKIGFADVMTGTFVRDDYKLLCPKHCEICRLRQASRVVTLTRGVFKLCNRVLCGRCEPAKGEPSCKCGRVATRAVQSFVYTNTEEHTFLDELCDSCEFTLEGNLINVRKLLKFELEVWLPSITQREFTREYRVANGKVISREIRRHGVHSQSRVQRRVRNA